MLHRQAAGAVDGDRSGDLLNVRSSVTSAMWAAIAAFAAIDGSGDRVDVGEILGRGDSPYQRGTDAPVAPTITAFCFMVSLNRWSDRTMPRTVRLGAPLTDALSSS